MFRIELIYDWICDMSSRVDAINNNKSVVRLRWFVIISQGYFFRVAMSGSDKVNLDTYESHKWNIVK